MMRYGEDSRSPSPVLDGDDVDVGIRPSVVGSVRGRRSFEYPVTLTEPLLRLGPSEGRSLHRDL
jgi:hypothetical protein